MDKVVKSIFFRPGGPTVLYQGLHQYFGINCLSIFHNRNFHTLILNDEWICLKFS